MSRPLGFDVHRPGGVEERPTDKRKREQTNDRSGQEASRRLEDEGVDACCLVWAVKREPEPSADQRVKLPHVYRGTMLETPDTLQWRLRVFCLVVGAEGIAEG